VQILFRIIIQTNNVEPVYSVLLTPMVLVPQMITVFIANHPVVFSPDDDKFHIEEFLKVYYGDGHLQDIANGMVFPDSFSNARLPVGTYKYQPSQNGERLLLLAMIQMATIEGVSC
jgi:hypothetical protein